jgi:hypothetical protein
MMKRKPVAVITPEGGPALYEEEETGLRLTASNFAERNGYKDEYEVRKALDNPKKEKDKGGKK